MNQTSSQHPSSSSLSLEQQVIKCYNSLIQTMVNDTQVIRKAESQLLLMSKSPDFIRIILSIPFISGISNDISKLAIIYLKTYIHNLLDEHKYTIVIKVAEQIINFISTCQLDFALKWELGTSLILVLSHEKNRALLPSCEQQLSKILQQSCLLEDPTKINFELICIFAHIVLDSIPNPIVNHYQFLQKTLPNLILISLKTIQLVSNAIQTNASTLWHALYIMSLLLSSILKYIKKLTQFSLINNASLYKLLNDQTVIQLIKKCLKLNLKNNDQPLPLFYLSLQSSKNGYNKKLVQNFHIVKSNAIQIIKQCTKILLKNIQYYEQSLIFKQAQEFIALFIKSISSLLEVKHYYNLEDKTQTQIIEQIYKYLRYSLNSNKHYKIFLQAKNMLIYGCIFKTLLFSPDDYRNFSQEPEEFVNAIYQVLQMLKQKEEKINKKEVEKNKIYQKGSNYMMETQQFKNTDQNGEILPQNEEIQLFDNLKSNSALLLINYVQHIDGVLLELVFFCVSVASNQTKQTVFKEDMLLFVLSILRNEVTNATLQYNIVRMLAITLGQATSPIKDNDYQLNPLNVKYALILVTMDQYLTLIQEFSEPLYQNIFLVIEQLIVEPMMEDVAKILGIQLIMTILKTKRGAPQSDKIAQLLSTHLEPQFVNKRSLDCIEMLIKQYGSYFRHQFESIIKISTKIITLLQFYIVNPQPTLENLFKLWNILEQITSHESLMPQIKPYLQPSLNKLIKLINGNNQIILEEHLYRVMVNIIRNTQSITKFELQIIPIAKRNFYEGNSKFSLKYNFEILQNIIFYGKDFLTYNIVQVKYILQMCCYSIKQPTVDEMPRSESQFCEGVLTMQSLIVNLSKAFDKEMWMVSLQCVYQKLKETSITYDFLKANLLTNMALILVFAYSFFTDQEVSQLMNIILKEYHCFTYKDSSKLFTTSIISLLPLTQVSFVQQYYSQLLDCIITILKMVKIGKDKILEKQVLDCEETQYFKLKSYVINPTDQLDEFQLFYEEIVKAKNKNPQLFDQAFASLAENKKQYMKQVLKVRKVNNQMRTIYKLKPKH